MPKYSYPHVRHAGTRTPFESADDLAEAVESLSGEHISVEFQRPNGIVSSLFFTVNTDGTFCASYGSSGFPMEKSTNITCDDVLAFLQVAS